MKLPEQSAGLAPYYKQPRGLQSSRPLQNLRVTGKEGIEDLEEYICSSFGGSPASEFHCLSPVRWIWTINKQKMSWWGGFIEIVAGLDVKDEDVEYIRVKLPGKEGTASIVGIRLNTRFWPAW